ncbi:hypothetical protein [Escherichia coli]|uniref:hypothetical protein n=1 Tax=Escherichia coli TaxID=562 RepID=UPI000B495A36|nr:hypothetical protein [Escherichia coli]EHN4669778.1 hypothetical protein [Escherichia coli]EHO7170176.1 hypothetical protein [Escherichia coli]EHW5039949.1 hypothetical protein [Escherichia coli]ELD1161591.1 hypothetical protein [Escherichia coli]QMA68007.1 hypothetical protein HV022_18615 [Escherichia coli]
MSQYAHANHINALAAVRKEKAEKAILPVEKNAAAASTEARVIYWTITREVVSYVQDPNRTSCNFGDKSMRLRQRPSTLRTPSADLMQEPCKASNAGRNSDEDLQADIETVNCLRQLRLDKYRWQAWYSANF